MFHIWVNTYSWVITTIGYHTILPFPLHHCIVYVCIINYVDCLSLWWCRTLFRDFLAVSWSELYDDIVWNDHDRHETIWKLKHLIRKEHFLKVNTSESHLNNFFLMFFFFLSCSWGQLNGFSSPTSKSMSPRNASIKSFGSLAEKCMGYSRTEVSCKRSVAHSFHLLIFDFYLLLIC